MPKRMKNFVQEIGIRQATKKDIPIILHFIKLLAEHHGKLDELVATEELLNKLLFGKDSHAEIILALQNKKPVGYALFDYSFSTLLCKTSLYLIDIFIVPEARRQCIGHGMFSYLARLAEERNYGRIEWSVLKKNKEAINLYESIGAIALDDWKLYRVSGKPLNMLASNTVLNS